MAVTMSAAEIAEFIADHGSAVLTTLRADGRPVPLLVWYDKAVFRLAVPPQPATWDNRKVRLHEPAPGK